MEIELGLGELALEVAQRTGGKGRRQAVADELPLLADASGRLLKGLLSVFENILGVPRSGCDLVHLDLDVLSHGVHV